MNFPYLVALSGGAADSRCLITARFEKDVPKDAKNRPFDEEIVLLNAVRHSS